MRISDWSSDVCSSDLEQSCRVGCPKRQRKAIGMMEVGLPGRMTKRPIALRSFDLLDHRRQRELRSRVGENTRFDTHCVAARRALDLHKIGRASCRERVCQHVWISVCAVSLKKK